MAAGIQVPPNCDLTLGMVCTDKTTPGLTVWTMTADERFCNPIGIMQGGFIAAFSDSAMGASSLTSVEGRKVNTANAEMKVSFLRAVQEGDLLTCTARVISASRRVAFVEAEVRNQDDVLVAKASSTYLLRDRT